MTGDLHGHMKNFDKLTRYAMLDRVAARHVILHEMVHCETGERAVDHSHHLLLQAAQYKCAFPDQVHFLQSNHELAQFTGYPIAKNGRPVIDDYNNSVEFAYGSDIVDEALGAMNEFISTFPIAIRTANRIWMSHSLPNRRDMEGFDFSVFNRELTREDIREDGPVFRLVWGPQSHPRATGRNRGEARRGHLHQRPPAAGAGLRRAVRATHHPGQRPQPRHVHAVRPVPQADN